MAEEAVKVQYVTDENGEIIKDENGNPIEQGAAVLPLPLIREPVYKLQQALELR